MPNSPVGGIAAVVTPLKDDESVDVESLELPTHQFAGHMSWESK